MPIIAEKSWDCRTRRCCRTNLVIADGVAELLVAEQGFDRPREAAEQKSRRRFDRPREAAEQIVAEQTRTQGVR